MSKTLLVIPHYNDTRRLLPFLKELMGTLPPHFSIRISDDGSREDEQKKLLSILAEAKALSASNGIALMDPILAKQNTGKGGAVYRGWADAEGFSMLAFADADGAVSSAEIIRAEAFLRAKECNADALLGSRVKMLGRNIHRSLVRHLTGRLFATLVSVAGKLPAYDTQCGLKIIRTEAYQKIHSHLQATGFAFDVELILLLVQSGCKVIEFPVDWHDVSGSKVNLFCDSFKMGVEVMNIRRRIDAITSK